MFTAAGKSAAASSAVYIEDVFSTYLYAGTAGDSTITNGIDLSGKGGLVWIKSRTKVGGNDEPHAWFDTARGATKFLRSNDTLAETTEAQSLKSFTSTGFTLGGRQEVNGNAATYTSWTFRKQAKFFDVVTYTGNGVVGRTVAHNLGSVPGCMIIKRTDTTSDWYVYHRSLGNTVDLSLNTTAAQNTATTWNNTTPTSTEFTLSGSRANINGATFVAYLFAHDAGGFGASGTDNVISCGSYTGTGANNNFVNVGFEPQWIMIKRAVGGLASWAVVDTMRALGADTPLLLLYANQPFDEISNSSSSGIAGYCAVTSTGFYLPQVYNETNASGNTYVYIAIRRGPMKTPTNSTTVFTPVARTGTGLDATVTGGSGVTDLAIIKNRGAGEIPLWSSRLTGRNYLASSSTAAQVAAGATILQTFPWDVMDGVKVGTTSAITNASGNTYINYLFDRAPGFFDVVCYTGNGAATQTVSHNLTVPPEMYFFRERAGGSWWLYHSGFPSPAINYYARLNATDAAAAAGIPVWGVSNTTFDVSTNLGGTTNTAAYIAYLFASCPGVSKVGSYTGTGTTQQIDCGFSNGSRFVMIKRVDSTGDWYVWDSARGIVAGNDPYFFMNSISNESTGGDLVDTYSLGFEISSTAPAAVNANGGRFIFLAIA